jgi:hypothetical protein
VLGETFKPTAGEIRFSFSLGGLPTKLFLIYGPLIGNLDATAGDGFR